MTIADKILRNDKKSHFFLTNSKIFGATIKCSLITNRNKAIPHFFQNHGAPVSPYRYHSVSWPVSLEDQKHNIL